VSLFRFLILTLRNHIPFLFISRQFKPDMLTLALHMIVAHYKLDASLALKTRCARSRRMGEVGCQHRSEKVIGSARRSHQAAAYTGKPGRPG
jgi:hypothetical protein